MNASILKNLEPSAIWKYFEEICSIPRASKKEEKIIQYLIDFAIQHHLDYKKDATGNLLISKNASPGFEDKPTIVLQSHVDMVCEKNETTNHNFDSDPIITRVEDGWVKATGTTLGADDGIGMAAQLAILHSNDINHGPIECLFTVDEETGLTGAYGLEPDFFTGKTLLNLDSEDEGILFIGCAGGMDTTGVLEVGFEKMPQNTVGFRVEISGLKGGHSGDDINKGLGNAVKIAVRIAYYLIHNFDVGIIDLQGGNLRNAIAREAFVEFSCHENDSEAIRNYIDKITSEIKDELKFTDSGFTLLTRPVRNDVDCISSGDAKRLIALLNAMPHGVIRMSHTIEGLVETSSNLASVKRIDHNTFEIGTSQRSSSSTLKLDIAHKVASVFNLAGIRYQHTTGYPGWNPNPNSQILKTAVECYNQLFGKKPVVTAIHAGLECGLFLEKYPGLDMVSFGPTIKGAHSPDERLEIASVEKFWAFLLKILCY
jgi:dipeptidase D